MNKEQTMYIFMFGMFVVGMVYGSVFGSFPGILLGALFWVIFMNFGFITKEVTSRYLKKG